MPRVAHVVPRSKRSCAVLNGSCSRCIKMWRTPAHGTEQLPSARLSRLHALSAEPSQHGHPCQRTSGPNPAEKSCFALAMGALPWPGMAVSKSMPSKLSTHAFPSAGYASMMGCVQCRGLTCVRVRHTSDTAATESQSHGHSMPFGCGTGRTTAGSIYDSRNTHLAGNGGGAQLLENARGCRHFVQETPLQKRERHGSLTLRTHDGLPPRFGIMSAPPTVTSFVRDGIVDQR